MTSPKRKKFRWNKIRGFRASAAALIATSFGAGLVPYAPGTMGSLVALPLAYATQAWDLPVRLTFWVVLFLLGVWAAKVLDEVLDSSDHGSICIDEVIGMGITAWIAGNSLTTWIVAFLLFRFFDVVKPFPIRQLDRWSKKSIDSPWRKGFGVVADDVLAGFFGLAVISLLQYFSILK